MHAPALSDIQHLSVQLLLLSGARPDFFGTKSSARLKAQDVGNIEALELFDSWEAGGREQGEGASKVRALFGDRRTTKLTRSLSTAIDAAMLLAMGSTEAEAWIVGNGIESDEIRQARAEAEAAQRQESAEKQTAGDGTGGNQGQPQPMPMDQLPQITDQPPTQDPLAPESMSFGSPSSTSAQRDTIQPVDAPISPSTKRKLHEVDSSTATTEPVAATSRPPTAPDHPMAGFFDVEGEEERPQPLPVARSAPSPTKKLRIELPSKRQPAAEVTLPSSTIPPSSAKTSTLAPRTTCSKRPCKSASPPMNSSFASLLAASASLTLWRRWKAPRSTPLHWRARRGFRVVSIVPQDELEHVSLLLILESNLFSELILRRSFAVRSLAAQGRRADVQGYDLLGCSLS